MVKIKICDNDKQIKELALLAKNIWNEYFINIITQSQIDYMIDKFQSYEAISQAIYHQGYRYFLLYDNNYIIGYCGVQPQDNKLFLSKLYLPKEQRGKGYASLLLNEAIDYAKSLNLSSIYLTCNKYNDNSLALYKHKGFEVIDHVQTEIGSGFIMDDDILSLNIK